MSEHFEMNIQTKPSDFLADVDNVFIDGRKIGVINKGKFMRQAKITEYEREVLKAVLEQSRTED